MFPNIVLSTKFLIDVLNQYVELNKPVQVKEVIERFAMDAIGSSAFGIELNTLQEKNEEFQRTIKETTKNDWRRLVAAAVNWRLLKFLGFRTRRNQVVHYFRDMVKYVTEYRKKNKIFRKDLFQFLSQLENSNVVVGQDLSLMKKHSLTLDQITTQCFSFFVGGFETSSVLISSALLEIALHSGVQNRLRQNIKENLEKYGAFSYEAVKDMFYLEWVINGKFLLKKMKQN